MSKNMKNKSVSVKESENRVMPKVAATRKRSKGDEPLLTVAMKHSKKKLNSSDDGHWEWSK